MPARVFSSRLPALLLPVPALVAGLLATSASAQAPSGGTMSNVPPADAYSILYYLTDEDGNKAGLMGQQHFIQFVNKARCECGHQLQTLVRLKTKSGTVYDQTTRVETFLGTNCATAELTPFGQFKQCAKFASNVVGDFVQGLERKFHPIWLSTGVDPSSTSRDPSIALSAGTCDNVFGQSGVWMCAQTNTMNNCQADEFFISGMQNANLPKNTGIGIAYDYTPPVVQPETIDSASGDGAVVVSWTLGGNPGDINGFRVLCEEADTGKPPPGKGMARPALNKIPNGTIYYTKGNLCGDKPFSLYTPGPSANTVTGSGDSTTSTSATTATTATTTTATTTAGFSPLFEASTGGTTGTTGGTTGATTGDTDSTTTMTTAASECGNLVVEGEEECDEGPNNLPNQDCLPGCIRNICGDADRGPDEQCDDGEENNGADKLCNSDCTLNISAGLKDLDWAYVCSDHLPFNTKSARITGLDNDKRYNFLLVSYDKFGNPAAFPTLVTATPVETYDLWDQCHALGDVCGESGFCNIAGDGDPLLGLGGLTGLGLGLLGLRRRMRNRA